MTWDHSYTAFAFGCVGGLAVNGLRIYALSKIPKLDRPDFDGLYWAQVVILAGLGGAAALAHDLTKQITPWVAFNVGLSVPALIKTGTEARKSAKHRNRRID